MTSWQDRARSFGGAADEYDRMRPGYPPELVDDVVRFASNGAAETLEVGAGTGKATIAFADRGIVVTAVEPDAAMAAVLTSRLAGRPNVTVVVSTFEEYVPHKQVDLLFSAQAWHWTDPASRWQRAAAAVSDGGALALFWNRDHVADPSVAGLMGSALATYAPQIGVDESIDEASLTMSWPWGDLDSRPEFTDLNVLTYRREWSISSADYVSNLSTHSAYRVLDPLVRERLFSDFRMHLPDRIDLQVATVLYLARRTRSGSQVAIERP